MTEHHSGVNTDSLKKQKSGEPRGASLYNDTPFRAEFLMLAAMGSMEEEAGWDFMMKEVVPKVMQEAREHSRTPHLDCAFIEGVMSGLNARRVLDAVGKRP